MTPKIRSFISLVIILVVLTGLGLASSALSNRVGPAQNVKAVTDVTNFTQQGSDGKTVLDILKTSHQVETIDQGSLGVYVRSIDGKQSGDNGFWLFYINGQMGQNSVEKTMTSNNQTIEWRYEKI